MNETCIPIIAARAEDKPVNKEDPAATKLLADAIAARAVWKDFPGFTADLEVNADGKILKGKVQVDKKGKVEINFEGKEDDGSRLNQTFGKDTPKATLASVIGHRMPGDSDKKTPCMFGDDNADHPQGRLVVALEDEMSSSFRIRDQQIMLVKRSFKSKKPEASGAPELGCTGFTISVTENRVNEEKHYLPISYVVNTWVGKELFTSKTYHHSWVRVATFDLPQEIQMVEAVGRLGPTIGGLDVPPAEPAIQQYCYTLKLSNHKLAK